MRFIKTVVCSVVVTTLAWSVAPAAGAEERPGGDEEIQRALERDLGWSSKQAAEIGALQERATEVDLAVQKQLGDAYAGAYFDSERGTLIVNTTTEAGQKVAQRAGAEGRLVKHSLGELDGIKAELDRSAGVSSDVEERRSTGRAKDIGLSAWSVDPVTNTVLVTVTEKQAAAAERKLAAYGDAVSIEVTKSAPETTANWMDGGDAVNSSTCSAGFNLRNHSTGAKYLLTAGHCVSAGSTLKGQGNVTFGKVLESWFPSYDDAIVRNENTGYWIQGPWVDTNPSNGGFINTSGYTNGLVGTTVCKSGITTKWTCGKITAKNQTVNYGSGNTVYGLTRHNACVEKGDSGGANVAIYGSTRRAEGVTSGASLIDWGGKKRCIGAIFGWLGLKSTSWYFPIADSLAYYGPKYGVSTW